MHSVFGIGEKGLNKVKCSKIDPFILVLSYLIYFQAGLNLPGKKSKKIYYLSTLFFFQGVTLNTHFLGPIN